MLDLRTLLMVDRRWHEYAPIVFRQWLTHAIIIEEEKEEEMKNEARLSSLFSCPNLDEEK